LLPETANVPEYTRPATWEDLKMLAQLLNEAQVEYALVGGYAQALALLKSQEK
jgi:hypothetical protein